MAGAASASITAQNTFTDAVRVKDGNFDVSISGTFSATVTIQRSRDGSTYVDLPDTYTAPTQLYGECASPWFYRVGVKTGEYTSGTVTVEIST